MEGEVSTRRAKELVQQAIDIAAEVSEPFRVAVFTKVFDFLHSESGVRDANQNAASEGSSTERGATNFDKRPRKGRSSTGAKGTASELIQRGYFDEARTVEDVIEHISLNLARSFPSKDLSKGLIRLVREGTLRREKSEDGKLRYRRA
jgi:hypothetical protein